MGLFVDQIIAIGLNAAIVAVTEETPQILTVKRADHALAENFDHPDTDFYGTGRPEGRDVLRERPTPGVGLPGFRQSL
jgi:hypothetical protein